MLWLQGQGIPEGARICEKKDRLSGSSDPVTNTVSHKMVITAAQEAKRNNVPIARIHTSSAAALKTVLDEYCVANA